MKKPLLLSLAVATLLTTNADAQSMLSRFEAMEAEMQKLREEISTLKSGSNKTADVKDADEEEDDDEDEGEDTESSDDDEGEEEEEEIDIAEELEDIKETLSDLNKNTSGNHLKFAVDYRFTLENLDYKMADGSKQSNDAFMTNRLWINTNWLATKNLSFSGQIAYNKAFGQRSGTSNPANASLENFDWIANENAFDSTLRVRSAYFLYRDSSFIGADIPWTFSIGRRPSTNGHLINLRDDVKAASPLGHSINVEFDGLSSKFSFDKILNGMYVKFCAGRGMSNAAPKFSSTPYAEDQTANTSIDLAGLIFVPYNDGQYSISTQYYYANNLIDLNQPSNPAVGLAQTDGFQTVGGMHSATANIEIRGVGNEWSDFLDDSTFFVSAAMSKTDPSSNQRMLYSTGATGESKTGYSYWAGLQFPSLVTEDGRWGVEFNHGSQYWRSITYGEDTNIGSKIAARGSAYEAYFTEYLVEDILSMQIRYTHIDYDYTGSNGFFGGTTGASMNMQDAIAAGMGSQVVDQASDLRFYLRYKY